MPPGLVRRSPEMPSAPPHPFPEYDKLSERASELREQLDRSRTSLVEDVRWGRIADAEIDARREKHFALVELVRQAVREAVDALFGR